MISRLDHLVLTVEDIPRSVAFYTKALGMRSVSFGESRIALSFGQQKINLHQNGREFERDGFFDECPDEIQRDRTGERIARE